MVSVIIPALNEAKTIRAVIRVAKKSSNVTEIIVVDDKSMDNTVEEALKEGVRIITSTILGKGASMWEGMLAAKNEVVCFLDADILTYPKNVVQRLTQDILNKEAQLVKSYFNRQAGRVTELVAKPLLSIFFPDLLKFRQPLSGMIAGAKSLFTKLNFENDYGVDVGILIDAHNEGAHIKEVNLGNIENDMQPLVQLGKMSREVATAILKRASLPSSKNLETAAYMTAIRGQMDFAVKESAGKLKKMIVFDMDNTLLMGSFIYTAAEKFGFKKELISIVAQNKNDFIRTKKIAGLLKGKNITDLIAVTDEIPLVDDAAEVIAMLKKRGYVCGIISDSYDCITNHLKNKLQLDFSFANELEFSKSIATGEVKIPSYFLKNENSLCDNEYDKSNVLLHVLKEYRINLKNTIAVGDGENDISMINSAGIGVSFNSISNNVDIVADIVVKEKSLKPLLEVAL
jgi:glucosyl-3-phosphoglycerate synthase